MAISSDSSDSQHNGNGITVDFATGFYFTNNSHIKVTVTDAAGADFPKVLGSDFTVVGASNPSGGTVTMAVAPISGDKLTIARVVPFTQEVEYPDNDPFDSSATENAFDKLTMLSQQVNRIAQRSFRVRQTDGALPESALVLNSIFGIDAAGMPYFLTPDIAASWFNISQQYFDRPMKTFANAAERALAVPEFVGQFGSQRDNRTIYMANGLAAGNWDPAFIIPSAGSILGSMLADGALTADSAGRLKMADGYLILSKIAAGIFTADATGRGKFANEFVTAALLAPGAAAANMPAGTIVKIVTAQTNTASTTTAAIPTDNTKPLLSEGAQILSASITPSSSSNKIIARYIGVISGSEAGSGVVFLCRAGDTECLRASHATITGANYAAPISLEFEDSPGSTSAQTYSIRCGPSSGTLYINQVSTARYGGALTQCLILMEVKG